MKFSVQLFAILLALTLGVLVSCKHEIYTNTGTPGNIDTTGTGTGSGANGTVCFESDILPMINNGCAKSGCHDAGRAAEGYVLNSYSNIMRKGIKAGNAGASKLYQVMLKSGGDKMPPPPNAAFTAAQIFLFAKWINEGAKNTTNCSAATCDTASVTYAKSIATIMTNNCVGCHSTSLANGGYDFTNYTGVKKAVTNGSLLGTIYYQSGFSGMPQGYRLQACQLATISKWVKAGALNN